MIHYTLKCPDGHAFESWFPSGSAYDTQVDRGLVTCPICGSAKITKALMAPRIARGAQAPAEPAPQAAPPDKPEADKPEAGKPQTGKVETGTALVAPGRAAELNRKLQDLRKLIEKNAENVGPRFAEEARSIHYGETEQRAIYGQSTKEESEALTEEGIPFATLPTRLPTDS